MAISRPQAIDDALGTSRSTAEDGGRAAILFRDAKALAPAENSRPAAIAAEAIEASAVLRPDQAIERQRGRVLTIGEGPGDPASAYRTCSTCRLPAGGGFSSSASGRDSSSQSSQSTRSSTTICRLWIGATSGPGAVVSNVKASGTSAVAG